MRTNAYVTLAAWLALGQVQAQGGFNRRYDPFGQHAQQFAWSVELRPDGNLICFGVTPWSDSLYYSAVVCAIELDPQGDVLSEHRVEIPTYISYPGWSNTSDRLPDGSFIVGGNTRDTASVPRATLFRFDSIGAITSLVQFDTARFGRQAKQAPDGGVLLCGDTNDGVQSDAFLIKTDSAGTLQWFRDYGTPTLQEGAISVDRAPSGGFFVGGEKDASPGIDQPWLFRVDSIGNMLWQHVYGPAVGNSPNAHLRTLADSNCVFASSFPTDAIGNYLMCMVKVDTAGTTLWEKTYGVSSAYQSFFSVIEESHSGDLVACGQSYQITNYQQGVLIRTTSSGDSLWMRHYYYADSLMSDGRGTLRDVVATPDGGFVAVGAVYSSASGNNPPGYNQDIWVVKVDSMGCIEPGCDGISTITTQLTNLRKALSISPNPAHGSAHLAWQLPAAFHGAAQLTVTSATGARVLTEALDLSRGSYDLDIHALAPGIYHVHIVQGGTWITGAKLVVE